MKKLAVLSFVLLFASAVMQSQAQVVQKESVKETKKEVKTEKKELKNERKALRKLEGNKVSIMAKNHFYTDFGNVPNVKWKRVDTYDEAAFVKGGKKMKAFYDADGNLVGTTSPKTFADLPAKGQQEIKAKYKGYTVGPILFYNDNETNETDMILYGLQFDDTDGYFVELTKGNDKIVVQVDPLGYVNFFKKL